MLENMHITYRHHGHIMASIARQGAGADWRARAQATLVRPVYVDGSPILSISGYVYYRKGGQETALWLTGEGSMKAFEAVAEQWLEMCRHGIDPDNAARLLQYGNTWGFWYDEDGALSFAWGRPAERRFGPIPPALGYYG